MTGPQPHVHGMDPPNSRRRAEASRASVGQHPDDPRFPSPSPDAAQNAPLKVPTFVTAFGFPHFRSWLWSGHSLAELMKVSVPRWTEMSRTVVDVPFSPVVPSMVCLDASRRL